MDFVKNLVDNFDSINPNDLESSQFYIYNAIDKYINYTIPVKEGKILYNKENYCTYCNLFKFALKNNIINLDMKNSEIYDKIPYDKLDKWTKYNIIRKLKNIEITPLYKTPHVSKIDNQYINEIIELSQNVINDVSKLYPIIQLMKRYNITTNDIIDMINEKVKK